MASYSGECPVIRGMGMSDHRGMGIDDHRAVYGVRGKGENGKMGAMSEEA